MKPAFYHQRSVRFLIKILISGKKEFQAFCNKAQYKAFDMEYHNFIPLKHTP